VGEKKGKPRQVGQQKKRKPGRIEPGRQKKNKRLGFRKAKKKKQERRKNEPYVFAPAQKCSGNKQLQKVDQGKVRLSDMHELIISSSRGGGRGNDGLERKKSAEHSPR